jgi:dihydroorotase
MNILIRSARIIDPTSGFHNQVKDILIVKGKIASIGSKLSNDNKYREITGNGLCVSPGWLDMFCFLGDPGYESKEDIQTGTRAAAAGGFTAVCAMPNTKPAIHSKSEVEYVINRSRGNIVDVFPLGAVSYKCEGVDITEIYDMQNAGAIAFTDGIGSSLNAGLMQRALLYVKPFNGVIISHPFERSIAKNGLINEGVVSTSLGVPGIPDLAEELIIARDIYLAEYTNSRLHFAFVSTESSVDLIRKAKARGVQVTCSVSPYNLSLEDNLLEEYDTNLKVMPPLRSKADINALVKGVKDGTIDTIASLHIPQDCESKEVEFDHAEFCMTGLETAFALINTYAGKKLDAEVLTDKLAVQPRKVLGLDIPSIAENIAANITIFDTETEWTFTAKDIRSRSLNTPFVGQKFRGKVLGVINNGQVHIN